MRINVGVRIIPALMMLAAGGMASAREKGAPSVRFFHPAIKVGDRLGTIFSKTVAITGEGFDPIVSRVSGTAWDEILQVSPDAVSEREHFVYDGVAAGSDTVVVHDGGLTNCVDGKCSTNDQTSAPLFAPLLWGHVPATIAEGTAWDVGIAAPWEIGPAGHERVRVTHLDPASGTVTVLREGRGTGTSVDDARGLKKSINSHGRALEVTIIPGESHWSGSATFRHGVTIADEILLRRPVELVAADGQRFHGEERIYTIFTETDCGSEAQACGT